MEGRRDAGDPLDHALDEVLARVSVGRNALVDLGTDVCRHPVELQQRLRVDTDHVVDDEFQTRQPDARIRDLRKAECAFRVADVHHHLDRHRRHAVEFDAFEFEIQLAVIHETGIPSAQDTVTG